MDSGSHKDVQVFLIKSSVKPMNDIKKEFVILFGVI
jgi:hypothetical protein